MAFSSVFAQRVTLTVVGLILPMLGIARDNPGSSNLVTVTPQSPIESRAPTWAYNVWTDLSCRQLGKPIEADYYSVEDAVQDTIPGEWWPRNDPAYTVPLNNGALKSAAIIIRTRIQYHVISPVPNPPQANHPYPQIYNTQNLAIGEGVPFCSAAMNTILPGRPSLPGGGSDYGAGSPDPSYQSNQAAQLTAGKVIVNQNGAVIPTEWTHLTVEKRSAICNDQSRDWGYCALNALADLLPGPGYAQNRFARRLNTTPPGRVEFKAQAYNSKTARSGRDWQLFTDGYMQALPNTNMNSYGGSQDYPHNSPDMTFMVPFPWSGSFVTIQASAERQTSEVADPS